MEKIGKVETSISGKKFIVDGFRKDSFGEVIMVSGRAIKKDGTIDKRYKRKFCAYC